MANEITKKIRTRVFCLNLYPEDITHLKAMEIISKSFEYAMITHDKDVDEDGVIKKEHCHFVIRFTNAKWNTAVAKDLGIELNYIQECRNIDNALMYLIHFNDKDKFQYDVDEVHGSLKTRLCELIQKHSKGESEKVCVLFDYIDNSLGLIRVKDFSRWCAANGYWDIYRRSSSIFLRVIDEHNSRYKGVCHNEY